MTTSTKRKREAKPRFAVGDTVQENSHNILINSPGAAQSKAKFKGLRVGEIKQVVTKANKGGAKCFYYEVLWKDMQSTQTISQVRLVLADGAC